MAVAGQGAMHAPQPVQNSPRTSGRKGAPMRGRNRIAFEGQASRQVMQETPRAARQESDTCTMCSNASGRAVLKTGSGQTSAQALQNTHSPFEKSRRGLPSAMMMICVGHAATQAEQPVQAPRPASVAPGGGRRVDVFTRPMSKALRLTIPVLLIAIYPPGGPGGPKIICQIQTRSP